MDGQGILAGTSTSIPAPVIPPTPDEAVVVAAPTSLKKTGKGKKRAQHSSNATANEPPHQNGYTNQPPRQNQTSFPNHRPYVPYLLSADFLTRSQRQALRTLVGPCSDMLNTALQILDLGMAWLVTGRPFLAQTEAWSSWWLDVVKDAQRRR